MMKPIWLLCLALGSTLAQPTIAVQPRAAPEPITLRAAGVLTSEAHNMGGWAVREIHRRFQQLNPGIVLAPTTGLRIPGRTSDIVPLMQIAGDIPPEVLEVDFRKSDTYVRNKFLYPLDSFVEKLAGAEIEAGHLLDLDTYLERLESAPAFQQQVAERAPRVCWPAMRRRCPYAAACPYLQEWGHDPAAEHYHTWSFPLERQSWILRYDRDLFAEAKLPDRAPEDFDELLEWSRRLTNPRAGLQRYGLRLILDNLGRSTLPLLYSSGGRLMEQDADGTWRCVFDSEEAVEAYYFVARLFLEPFENEHGRFESSVGTGQEASSAALSKWGMHFSDFGDRYIYKYADWNQWGFGPVPAGAGGRRGTPVNARMLGIYAGIDKAKLEAAWRYIDYFDGSEANAITATTFVEAGFAQCVRPPLLRAAGYEHYLDDIPTDWNESLRLAADSSVPEPYGENAQMVYQYVHKAIAQIRTDEPVAEAIRDGKAEVAKQLIRDILHARVIQANEKMLGVFGSQDQGLRRWVAAFVALGILIVFVLVFRNVLRSFESAQPGQDRRSWQFGRYKWAYLLLLPALAAIGMWAYYPLVRGSVMAFQEYNVRGTSRWVGMENFAFVLFDPEFWFSMWISIKYAFLFMTFGFVAPIALALLLSEVPRGRVLFRTIYYLPTVLAGVVVIFLWKGFYGQFGMINHSLNYVIDILNQVPGIALEHIRMRWLTSPSFALIACLLPSIWAGMGPGCLIYLAALKTVPEELYDAADVDGAGIWHKTTHVALPSIRGLILINFIGAMIGAVRSGSEFILAMTGGGPYNPYGQTEVVGLRIFMEAFAYLRFGAATAMAWVVGSLLVGFTVLQLKRLSRMEFKTAESAAS